ncbi:MAG: B12-binding domain-containing radical SAM protein [Nanoarchaeota archaeon]|nr:B12-binding domain-containing radical SAM protein [Nanoarchaeota archaeon]
MVKVVFLQNIWYEYLGVMYLSGMLKSKGHKCDVLLGKDDYLIKELRRIKPDLIAFSAMTLQHKWVCKLAELIKRKGIKVPIIVGGSHPTFFPDMINDSNIDMICIGEGEEALLELADKLNEGKDITKIQNLFVKKKGRIYKNDVRKLVENLDELPFPDRKLYLKYDFFRKKQATVFMAWRGCPYRCSFCFNHSMLKMYKDKGKYIRVRSPENIIKEIKEADRIHKIKNVMFIDSTFNLKKSWVIDFMKEYKNKLKLKFSCNLRADLVDENVVRAVAETKCCENIRFAMETGNEKLRNEVLCKDVTNKQILNANKLFRKYKLKVVVFNMFGLPGESLENSLETIELTSKIKPYVTSNYIFAPFPGIRITDLAIEKGFMDERDFEKLSMGKYKIHRSVLKQKDIDEVSNLHKFSVLGVKFPFLMFLIKWLIKLPPNFVFDHVYNLTEAWEWRKWENVSFLRFSQEIIKNYQEFS